MSKYEPIYRKIKSEIENGKYHNGDFLPSEKEYTEMFSCTRNTVRRAISLLTNEGYLIPQHGKGVQVIYEANTDKNIFTVGGIESFQEAIARNKQKVLTKVITFEETVVDEEISYKTGLDIGEEIYFVERIRYFDNKALIYDINYFLKKEVSNLTKEIAKKSIYEYLENELNITISNSRRRVYAEDANKKDKKYLDLDKYTYLLVVSGQVFNNKGVMFEYTESRHRPDHVCFVESAIRQKI